MLYVLHLKMRSKQNISRNFSIFKILKRDTEWLRDNGDNRWTCNANVNEDDMEINTNIKVYKNREH